MWDHISTQADIFFANLGLTSKFVSNKKTDHIGLCKNVQKTRFWGPFLVLSTPDGWYPGYKMMEPRKNATISTHWCTAKPLPDPVNVILLSLKPCANTVLAHSLHDTCHTRQSRLYIVQLDKNQPVFTLCKMRFTNLPRTNWHMLFFEYCEFQTCQQTARFTRETWNKALLPV